MPKVAQLLYADVIGRKFTDAAGSTFTFPTLTLGDTLVCQQRFLTRDGDGVRERQVKVRNLKASIGPTMEPPAEGSFSLKYSTNAAVGPFTFDQTAETMKAALVAAHGDARIPYECLDVRLDAPCCWMVRFDHDDAVTLTLADDSNTLLPESFVRLRAFQSGSVWWLEIRLIQMPLAFTSGHDRVLAPPPTVREIDQGTAPADGDPGNNEVQALTVPIDFRGTFYLVWNGRRSSIIGFADGPDNIKAALAGMFQDGGTRFAVTNPAAQQAYIEFKGDLGLAPQPEMTVTVSTFEPGVLTYRLFLGRPAMFAALRSAKTITVPLETEIEYVEDDEDPDDTGVESQFLTCSQMVTIVREQIFDELAAVEAINWLNPFSPTSYKATGLNNVITGSQYLVRAIGDGSTLEISVAHNLGTSDLLLPALIDKVTGRYLVHGGEYEVTIPLSGEGVLSPNVVVFSLATAAVVNGLRLVIATAGPKSAFVDGLTVSIEQVETLADLLAALNAALAALQTQVVTTPPSLPSASGIVPVVIELPDQEGAFPGKVAMSGGKLDLTKLPRPQGLLPALHDATVTSITSGGLPSIADSLGNVFQNNTSGQLLVPGGLGVRGSYLAIGDYAGSDGRRFYPLTHAGSTKSYFPRDYERQLFEFELVEGMLRKGSTLRVQFLITTQMLQATCDARWELVIEHGVATSQTAPSTTAPNFEAETWNATPLLRVRLGLGPVKVTRSFGVEVVCGPSGTLSANKVIDGTRYAADSIPAAADAIYRARLVNFDTPNAAAATAKGTVYYAFSAAEAKIA